MPAMKSSNERVDSVLTLARTRAAAYADDGNLERAYQALLRGVQSAQRTNSAGRTGTVLRRLWATPGVKAALLAAPPAVLAAVTGTKAKKSTSDDGSKSTSDSSRQAVARYRLRGRRAAGVTVEDETKEPVTIT